MQLHILVCWICFVLSKAFSAVMAFSVDQISQSNLRDGFYNGNRLIPYGNRLIPFDVRTSSFERKNAPNERMQTINIDEQLIGNVFRQIITHDKTARKGKVTIQEIPFVSDRLFNQMLAGRSNLLASRGSVAVSAERRHNYGPIPYPKTVEIFDRENNDVLLPKLGRNGLPKKIQQGKNFELGSSFTFGSQSVPGIRPPGGERFNINRQRTGSYGPPSSPPISAGLHGRTNSPQPSGLNTDSFNSIAQPASSNKLNGRNIYPPGPIPVKSSMTQEVFSERELLGKVNRPQPPGGQKPKAMMDRVAQQNRAGQPFGGTIQSPGGLTPFDQLNRQRIGKAGEPLDHKIPDESYLKTMQSHDVQSLFNSFLNSQFKSSLEQVKNSSRNRQLFTAVGTPLNRAIQPPSGQQRFDLINRKSIRPVGKAFEQDIVKGKGPLLMQPGTPSSRTIQPPGGLTPVGLFNRQNPEPVGLPGGQVPFDHTNRQNIGKVRKPFEQVSAKGKGPSLIPPGTLLSKTIHAPGGPPSVNIFNRQNPQSFGKKPLEQAITGGNSLSFIDPSESGVRIRQKIIQDFRPPDGSRSSLPTPNLPSPPGTQTPDRPNVPNTLIPNRQSPPDPFGEDNFSETGKNPEMQTGEENGAENNSDEETFDQSDLEAEEAAEGLSPEDLEKAEETAVSLELISAMMDAAAGAMSVVAASLGASVVASAPPRETPPLIEGTARDDVPTVVTNTTAERTNEESRHQTELAAAGLEVLVAVVESAAAAVAIAGAVVANDVIHKEKILLKLSHGNSSDHSAELSIIG